MEYKVGDKVPIKALDWYNKNKNEDGDVSCGEFNFVKGMKKFCSETLTISEDADDGYLMLEDYHGYVWTDEMFEGLVERNGKTYPYKIGDRVVLKGNNRCATITDLKYNSWGNLSYYIKIDNDKDISIDYPTDLLLPYDNMVEGLVEKEISIDLTVKGEDVNERIEIAIPEGYEYAIESSKIIFTKKKKEYPKTYEECCKLLCCKPIFGFAGLDDEEENLYGKFIALKRCRDAYWKIAGDEMGLGKPWKPDVNEECFSIARSCGEVLLFRGYGNNEVFEFPTEEMRDVFYENFKEEIEMCKELL